MWAVFTAAVFGAGYWIGSTYWSLNFSVYRWFGVVVVVALAVLAGSVVIYDEAQRVRTDSSNRYSAEYALYIYLYLRMAEAVVGVIGGAIALDEGFAALPFVLLYGHAVTPLFWRASCDGSGPSIE